MGLFDLGDFVPKVEITSKNVAKIGMSLVGTGAIGTRADFDYYATPFDATRDILNKEKLEGSILEPCAGQGHIVAILKDYYPEADIVATDLIDRPNEFNIECGIDFLQHNYGRKFDNIITNPPFSIAKEFCERAIMMANKRVFMFLKINFLEGVSRKEFFENSPLHYIYVFSRRVSPLKNGSDKNEAGKDWHSTMCFAWFIWDIGYEGEPIVRWI